ncbi:hypothetical protein [uncultured Hymenobacter sp.]|uniref:hypothetical protein n=1 Tax=uncultured Hymenobacter sp. TaxID=170016 RepID=UPI0035C9EF16
MQLRFTKEEDFRQERDFGAKIGATFEFVGAHWRPLGKCLVYFVLPVALLMGIGLGVLTNGMWNMTASRIQSGAASTPYSTGASFFNASYFFGIALAVIAGLLAFSMLLSTLYAYVRILLIEEPTYAPTPSQVWTQIKPRFGRMFLALGLFFGLYVFLMAVFGSLIALTAFSGIGGVGVFLIFLLLIPLLFYVVVPLSLYFPALWMEDIGVLETLQRCFYLVRSHWWASLGLLIVAGMIQGLLTILFILPQYAGMFGKMLKVPVLSSDAFGIAAQCFYACGVIFTYSVSLLAMLFQYFNLVEKKEGLGLRNLVANLGNGAAPAAYNSAYRPDEEGEY